MKSGRPKCFGQGIMFSEYSENFLLKYTPYLYLNCLNNMNGLFTKMVCQVDCDLFSEYSDYSYFFGHLRSFQKIVENSPIIHNCQTIHNIHKIYFIYRQQLN